MEKTIVTDFLNYEKKISSSNKYLELPKFNEKFEIKESIYFKNWNKSELKLNDIKKNLILYNFFLDELIIFLNNYHKTNYSKRYWTIIVGQWLFKFISSVTIKWIYINSLKSKYLFLKKKINKKDIISVGIEDFMKISNSDYWNHYCYTKIIEHSFIKKFKIIKVKNNFENIERKIIYRKLNNKKFKEKISLIIQRILNFWSQNKSTLIFSTFMSNLQELRLNFAVNKSLIYYKTLRPYKLFENKKLYKFHRKKFKPMRSPNCLLGKFLGQEILNCLPSSYLENYREVEKIVKHIPFPKSPKKIFTTLGIYRSTLMDRYIAKNVEKGSSLILSQHGGAYFQHKYHFSSIHEVKISDKYLSWGNVNKNKLVPIGVIKNLNKISKKSNNILLEVRKRTKYNSEIKLDTGLCESDKYFKNLCKFFSLLKENELNKNLYIKLHEAQSFWQEKKQFLFHNPNLKFLDEKKNMIRETSQARLVIHTFCGTGHIESIAINKPTLIFYIHSYNLLNNKTKNYFKKLEKLDIVHRTPQSLFSILKKLSDNNKIENWWFSKKRQNLLDKYRSNFGFFNKNKISDLKKIINNI